MELNKIWAWGDGKAWNGPVSIQEPANSCQWCGRSSDLCFGVQIKSNSSEQQVGESLEKEKPDVFLIFPLKYGLQKWMGSSPCVCTVTIGRRTKVPVHLEQKIWNSCFPRASRLSSLVGVWALHVFILPCISFFSFNHHMDHWCLKSPLMEPSVSEVSAGSRQLFAWSPALGTMQSKVVQNIF